ncbi:MAG: cupin domain-containing protein [Peptococcaceae bacterium]|jgi:quercetin dioxygenase-like cupin family protein|nr:cupin domain-containing protein [Peptococcaceae bacterium]MDH7525969.1 cupin domain-containing protein [Peptococcaceae bacterium]
MATPKVFDLQEVIWEDMGSGLPRTAIFQGSEHLTIQCFELPPHSQGAPHSHEHEQIVYIQQGKLGFWIDGKTYKAGSGCIVLIPSNCEHYGMNLGSQTAITVEIFVPKRADRQQSKNKDGDGA